MSLLHVSPTISRCVLTTSVNLRRRDRAYQAYLELAKLIPSFKDRVADPNEESREFYYSQVSQLHSPCATSLTVAPSSYLTVQTTLEVTISQG